MEYNGYDLFMDVEDAELQARNRAMVLWNMFEENSKNGRANARGLTSMLGYIKNVPEDERAAAISKLQSIQTQQEGNA